MAQPGIVALLSSARQIIAVELAYMHCDVGQGGRLGIGEAKKLQIFIQTLATARGLEEAENVKNMGELSDDELHRRYNAKIAQAISGGNDEGP
jgi:hypothetical protein